MCFYNFGDHSEIAWSLQRDHIDQNTQALLYFPLNVNEVQSNIHRVLIFWVTSKYALSYYMITSIWNIFLENPFLLCRLHICSKYHCHYHHHHHLHLPPPSPPFTATTNATLQWSPLLSLLSHQSVMFPLHPRLRNLHIIVLE